MDFTKFIQLTLILIECCFAVSYGYIIIKIRRARLASNITIPKSWRIISIYGFIFIIVCIAFLLLSLLTVRPFSRWKSRIVSQLAIDSRCKA